MPQKRSRKEKLQMWTTVFKTKTLFLKKLRSTTWFASSLQHQHRTSIPHCCAYITSYILWFIINSRFILFGIASSSSIAFTSLHHKFKYSKVCISKSTRSVILYANRRKIISKMNQKTYRIEQVSDFTSSIWFPITSSSSSPSI